MRSSARRAAPLLLLCAFAAVACRDDDSPPTPAAQTPGAAPAAKTAAQQPSPRVAQEPVAQEPVVGERIRLLLSGSLNGRLEPCGCAGGQAGGLARRMQVVKDSHVHDLLIEGGDLVEEANPLEQEKAFTAMQVLFGFGVARKYDALGIGPRDLELPFDEWTQFVAASEVPAVASDLQSTAGGWPAVAFLEKDVRGTKVRIASLALSLPKALAERTPAPLVLLTPDAAWARALQGAPPETRRILLVHGSPEQVRKLAGALQPQPDLVAGIDPSSPEPPSSAETVARTPVVFPGIRGRWLLDVTIARAADGPRVTAYEPLLLQGSETKPDAGEDKSTRETILQHRKFVADDNVLEKMADRSKPAGAGYVGSDACASCHQADFTAWKRSKHSEAWTVLEDAEKKRGWPVTRYPDCVSCHVVGYRKPGGFVTPEASKPLLAVGCERCHGPGSEHVASEGATRLGKVADGLPGKLCTQCHDFEQSPKFDYTRFWAVIQHGAKATPPKKPLKLGK